MGTVARDGLGRNPGRRGPIAHEAKHQPSAADAWRQAHFLGDLRMIYPVPVGLSPNGFGWLGETPSARLDFGSRAGFGLYDVKPETRLTSQLVPAAPMIRLGPVVVRTGSSR